MSIPPQGLRPVEDRTLRAQVARQILDMVTGGLFHPGQRLTETDLASKLQVSRAPLREAVRELVDKGILVSQPYKGLRVRDVGRKDLEELYSMRISLERFAFTLAWPLRTPEAISDLDDRYQTLMEALEAGDQARAVEKEIDFHTWVYDTSGHQLLLDLWGRIASLVQIYMSLHHGVHGAHGVFRDMTTKYREFAEGSELEPMLDHIEEHMRQGFSEVLRALPEPE